MNNITSKELIKLYDREDLFSLANSWLNLKAYAEITREEIDKIYNGVLAEFPMYATNGGRLHGDGSRITNHNHTYLCEDENILDEYYSLCDAAARAAGIKPADMDRDHCPALVAEDDLRKIEHAIWDITLPILGINREKLFHYKDGKFAYEEFNRLTLGAIISHPNFKPENYALAKKKLQEVKKHA